MRAVSDLGRDQLAEIVESIQGFLYLDLDQRGAEYWNPDKQWSGADVCQQELAELAHDFNRDIDGGEYSDDNEYWESNDARVEDNVAPEEQSSYRAIRKDGGLVWRDMDEPDEPDELADDVEGPPAESKTTGKSTKRPYRVWDRDNRQVLFIIDAVNADGARRRVEQSEDADEEFGGTINDSQWYIEQVELASTA